VRKSGREEYIKFGLNKALEVGMLGQNRAKFDVAKVQEITNSVVYKADQTLFTLQKQYKIERQQEMQQDRQRQMSRGMDR
jgi:hypothetical protein